MALHCRQPWNLALCVLLGYLLLAAVSEQLHGGGATTHGMGGSNWLPRVWFPDGGLNGGLKEARHVQADRIPLFSPGRSRTSRPALPWASLAGPINLSIESHASEQDEQRQVQPSANEQLSGEHVEGVVEKEVEQLRRLSLDTAGSLPCLQLPPNPPPNQTAVDDLLRLQATAVLKIYEAAGCMSWVAELQGKKLSLCSWPGVLCGKGKLAVYVEEGWLSDKVYTGPDRTALQSFKNLSTTAPTGTQFKDWLVTAIAIQGLTTPRYSSFSWTDPDSTKTAYTHVIQSAMDTERINITTCWLNKTGSLEVVDFSPLVGLQVLSVRRLNITGAFPRRVTQLCGLTYLNFQELCMTGEVPGSVANLENLTFFSVSENLQGPSLLGLSGRFPSGLLKLQQLQQIYLFNNSFSESLPDEIFRLPALERLGLSKNNFSGVLPTSLPEARKLYQLSLDNNNLTGPLPAGWSSMPALKDVLLCQNSFTGPIPEEFSRMIGLSRLCLSQYPGSPGGLTGRIPDLSRLKDLIVLKLAFNKLQDKLPLWIQTLPNLTKLALDNNRLYGEFKVPYKNGLVRCNATDGGNKYVVNFQNNFFDSWENGTFLPGTDSGCFDNFTASWLVNTQGNCFGFRSAPNDPTIGPEVIMQLLNGSRSHKECNEFYKSLTGKTGFPLALVLGAVGGILVAVCGLCCCVFVACRRGRYDTLPKEETAVAATAPDVIKVIGRGGLLVFTAKEIASFTKDFQYELGRGGFGQVVWGQLPDGTEVAVKCGKSEGQGRRELLNEIETVGLAKHRHLVNIIGYCIDEENEILVYEYASGGSLGNALARCLPLKAQEETPTSLQMTASGSRSSTSDSSGPPLSEKKSPATSSTMSSMGTSPSVLPSPSPGPSRSPGGPQLPTRMDLSWEARLQIALGAAQAVRYLHYEAHASKALIHRDIKTSNILIDGYGEAKVADFGLTKITHTSPRRRSSSGASEELSLEDASAGRHQRTGSADSRERSREEADASRQAVQTFTMIKGTPGYIDPEYAAGKPLGLPTDVYSFGVVLWVLITGREPRQWYETGPPSGEYLDRVVDRNLQTDAATRASIKKVAEVADACIWKVSYGRPTMKEVVAQLECAAACLDKGQGTFGAPPCATAGAEPRPVPAGTPKTPVPPASHRWQQRVRAGPPDTNTPSHGRLQSITDEPMRFRMSPTTNELMQTPAGPPTDELMRPLTSPTIDVDKAARSRPTPTTDELMQTRSSFHTNERRPTNDTSTPVGTHVGPATERDELLPELPRGGEGTSAREVGTDSPVRDSTRLVISWADWFGEEGYHLREAYVHPR